MLVDVLVDVLVEEEVAVGDTVGDPTGGVGALVASMHFELFLLFDLDKLLFDLDKLADLDPAFPALPALDDPFFPAFPDLPLQSDPFLLLFFELDFEPAEGEAVGVTGTTRVVVGESDTVDVLVDEAELVDVDVELIGVPVDEEVLVPVVCNMSTFGSGSAPPTGGSG